MINPLEVLFIQLAHHCAVSRNLPFKVDTTIWETDEKESQIDIQILLRYAHRHTVLNTVFASMPLDGVSNVKHCWKRAQKRSCSYSGNQSTKNWTD